MRNRAGILLLAALTVLALSPALRAQESAPKSNDEAASAKESFDPHDLSGVWNMQPPKEIAQVMSGGHPSAENMKKLIAYFSTFNGGDLPMTPWAQKLFDESKPSFGPRSVTIGETNDPVYKCFPPGAPRVYLHPFPMQIVQTKKEVILLYEYDHTVRHIFTDGRPHPQYPELTYMGDSIGHWEGDTLVVDTIGFNDKTWLDRVGHPHSTELHLIERFHRTGPRELQLDMTIEDPKAYTHPINSTLYFRLHPDWSIMEQVCMDNVDFLPFESKEDKGANAENAAESTGAKPDTK